jgi:transposase
VEKGGLTVALAEAGLRSGDEVYASDEMRLGLRGMVRRVLAPKGVRVVQPLQLRYEWVYLLLAVNPETGELRWRWIERMRQEHIKPVLSEWALEGLIWDRAPSHRAKSLRELPTELVFLPSYSPELNPAERVFEEVRRLVEGRAYDSIGDKQAEVEGYLGELDADRERVKRLCGWEWMREALERLPPPSEATA